MTEWTLCRKLGPLLPATRSPCPMPARTNLKKQSPIETGVISSVTEARSVLAHHYREQRAAGLVKRPYMWVSLSEPPILVVVVETAKTNGKSDWISSRPYQYTLTGGLDEVRELIQEPYRSSKPKPKALPEPLKQPLKKPLRQLHAFSGPGQ